MKKLEVLSVFTITMSLLCACSPASSKPAETEVTSVAVTESIAEETETTAEPETTVSDVKAENEKITIYLVRHGKTFFNTTDQVQGWVDSPLTEVGEAQADAVGIGLKDIEFVTAFSSDLGRQRLTAKRILAQNSHETPEIVEIIGLREWFYGGYEGKTNAEMWDPIFTANGLTFDEDWSQYEELTQLMSDEDIANAIAANDELGEAETYEEIAARSHTAVDEMIRLTEAAGGGNALAVSSGSEIPTILELVVPGQYQGEDISNCSVTILSYENGEFTLEACGDKSYLAAGQQ